MESFRIALKSSTGEILISGPLQAYQDHSYDRLFSNMHLQAFELGRPLENYMMLSEKSLLREFHALKIISSQPIYTENFISLPKAEQFLNRYPDCLPYGFNSIRLPKYINASVISGVDFPLQKNLFIATQGPLPYTIGDFWDMVVKRDCSSVFMLCGVEDCRKGKCEVYWPDCGSEVKFGEISVKNLNEELKNRYVARTIEVRSENLTRIVKAYQYLDWPDKRVPEDIGSLESLIDEMHERERINKSIVVHCSAGVGRTGTIIALSQLKTIIKRQIEAGVDLGVSVFSIIRRLREQRLYMVETYEQYALICKMVFEWAKEVK